ncbi:MAG TPA: sialidase family protein [Ignavibacteria bacterium]|nr:sialidase family protein [Ignavibacteria bacterium]
MNKFLIVLILVSNISEAQNINMPSTVTVAEISSDSYLGYNNANLICYDKNGNGYIAYTNKKSVNILFNKKDSEKWEYYYKYNGNGIGLPAINILNDTLVCVVWTEKIDDAKNEIKLLYFSTETDTVKYIFTLPTIFNSIAPSFATGDKKIYVTWCETNFQDTVIKFSAFNIMTNLFSEPEDLSIIGIKSDCPGINSSGENVFVCWRDSKLGENQKIYTRVSTNGGKNWGDITLASHIDEFDLIDPVISYSKNYQTETGVLYLSYFGNNKIFLQKSYDLGKTWSSEVIVSNNGAFPRIANNDSGFVLISFEYLKTPENPNVFIDSLKDVGLAYSFDNSNTFSDDTLARTFENAGNVLGSVYKITENEFVLIWLSKLKTHNKINLSKIYF